MLTEIFDAKVELIDQSFLTPLKISSGSITTLPEAEQRAEDDAVNRVP